MNNLMGGEAIAHAIIGPGLGLPVSLMSAIRCNISDRESDNYTGHRKLGTELYCQISIVTWYWAGALTIFFRTCVSKVSIVLHFTIFLMIVILSLPDLWTVSSSGSGNGYQGLFTTRLSNDGMWVILSQTSTTDLMITVFLCTQGPYLSLSRKTVWSILLPPFLQMIIRKAGIKEAARSNTNSSCVCVF